MGKMGIIAEIREFIEMLGSQDNENPSIISFTPIIKNRNETIYNEYIRAAKEKKACRTLTLDDGSELDIPETAYSTHHRDFDVVVVSADNINSEDIEKIILIAASAIKESGTGAVFMPNEYLSGVDTHYIREVLLTREGFAVETVIDLSIYGEELAGESLILIKYKKPQLIKYKKQQDHGIRFIKPQYKMTGKELYNGYCNKDFGVVICSSFAQKCDNLRAPFYSPDNDDIRELLYDRKPRNAEIGILADCICGMNIRDSRLTDNGEYKIIKGKQLYTKGEFSEDVGFLSADDYNRYRYYLKNRVLKRGDFLFPVYVDRQSQFYPICITEDTKCIASEGLIIVRAKTNHEKYAGVLLSVMLFESGTEFLGKQAEFLAAQNNGILTAHMIKKIRLPRHNSDLLPLFESDKDKENQADIKLSVIMDELEKANKQLSMIGETSVKTLDIAKNTRDLVIGLNDEIKKGKEELSEEFNSLSNTDDIESKISLFADEVAKKINNQYASNKTVDLGPIEADLIKAVTKDVWNKMEEISQRCLLSAEIMYKQLAGYGASIDFSGVCILATKTLEIELKKRFYRRLQKYLEENYSGEEKYLEAISYKGKDNRWNFSKEDKVTLGTMPFVFGVKTDFAPDKRVIGFLVDNLMIFKESADKQKEAKAYMRKAGQMIKDINEKYRRPAAHVNSINMITAQQCLDYLVGTKKALKEILGALRI